MNRIYPIRPYAVGKDKRSLAMVIPSEIVKALEINPQSVFLLLKVKSAENLQIQIIREDDLAKKDNGNIQYNINNSKLNKSTSLIDVKNEGEKVED